MEISRKRKELAPLLDHHGNECWWTELLFITDNKFPVGDYRDQVAVEVNRHLTDAGIICGSGKWDPGKAIIQIEGVLYRRFKTKGGKEPHCQLCESGDVIKMRFFDSTYKPEPPAQS